MKIQENLEQIMRKRCYLCGRSRDQVEKLILGVHGGVCANCIELAYSILHSSPEEQSEALVAARERAQSERSKTLLQRLFSKPKQRL
ncbi:hypothetical protein CCAX7_006200 [Capsulimonas corticalis]|uniref:Uncharacterized protein n=1 Tax=Capsulimonas corticalis TaxID=2219043 RepID=A0A402D3K5_9BACT|nr:ClpX C4-type zinc finger protein [Capsulimonas corticalis]BDI28569.1 hypothetical protein CCAX7_006200 [Capsulimonas corticalis]